MKRSSSAAAATEDLDCRIVEAVAAARGVEPLELDDRLYDVIDPDAIAKLFSTGGRRGPPVRGRVSFTLDRCQVTVHDDLSVDVRTHGAATAD